MLEPSNISEKFLTDVATNTEQDAKNLIDENCLWFVNVGDKSGVLNFADQANFLINSQVRKI